MSERDGSRAVAMNARGGPGIVLASVAFDAGIVSRSFFASLVMLAVVTSLFAGARLDRVVRSGSPLPHEREGRGADRRTARTVGSSACRSPSGPGR